MSLHLGILGIIATIVMGGISVIFSGQEVPGFLLIVAGIIGIMIAYGLPVIKSKIKGVVKNSSINLSNRDQLLRTLCEYQQCASSLFHVRHSSYESSEDTADAELMGIIEKGKCRLEEAKRNLEKEQIVAGLPYRNLVDEFICSVNREIDRDIRRMPMDVDNELRRIIERTTQIL